MTIRLVSIDCSAKECIVFLYILHLLIPKLIIFMYKKGCSVKVVKFVVPWRKKYFKTSTQKINTLLYEISLRQKYIWITSSEHCFDSFCRQHDIQTHIQHWRIKSKTLYIVKVVFSVRKKLLCIQFCASILRSKQHQVKVTRCFNLCKNKSSNLLRPKFISIYKKEVNICLQLWRTLE